MKKENLRKEKGITLIALVITIIVLLILTGVTIATLTGDNGILTQANKAKTSNTEGEASEQFALLANEWAIEKNTSNKTLGEFLNGKITEGKLSSIEDNENGTYTVKLNGYQTIIDQNGKTSSVFNPEEWDKTATPEDCFIWGSDTKGEDGYNVIIGYTEKLENYTKAKIPTRCKRIICDGSYYSNNQYSDDQIGRAFFSNVEKVELPSTVVEIGDYAFGNINQIKNSLKEIVIPNSVSTITGPAFAYCTNIEKIIIPSSVTTIIVRGWPTFSGWTSEQTINIERYTSNPDRWMGSWSGNCDANIVWGYTGE